MGKLCKNWVKHTNDFQNLLTLTILFYRFRNPNPSENIQNVDKWEPVRSEKLEYYNIKNYDTMKMEENLYEDRVKFWRSLPTDPERTKIRDEL